MSDKAGLDLLIVDDDAGMRRSLRRIMKMRGYEVSLAESGREAIEWVRQHEPDGILMDIRMPGLNGVETYRQIRDICPESFVVFMTAYSDLVDEARHEGAVQVLSKPLDIDAACSLIEKTATTRPVLVIDDDPAFSKSLARSLAVKGWEIQTASSQEEALEFFSRNRRCIVLLDMKLNGITGLDLLVSLKQFNAKAIVIQMSGFSEMDEMMQQGLERSCYTFLTKPFDVDELITVMQGAAKGASKPR